MGMLRFQCLALLTGLALAPSLCAADAVFESGRNRTALLELFTSEGCSSCPPAEKWLSSLKDQPALWRDFVPLAFHVDYWDQLGWRDPFASKNFTARQSAYAAQWQRGSVYTPAFVLNGREWRDHDVPAASTESAGVLKLVVAGAEKITATFEPDGHETLELHVVRLGLGLKIDVKAGENGGRKLTHDFVVLALASTKMADGKAELPMPIPPAGMASGSRGAIAAWVTQIGRSEPLQAVGGWLQ